jgi:hypothetical protein
MLQVTLLVTLFLRRRDNVAGVRHRDRREATNRA